MKNRSTLTSLLVSMPLFAALISPAVAFDEGDLEGSWFGVEMYVSDIGTVPWITEYRFDVDAHGEISGTFAEYRTAGPAHEYEVAENSESRLEITPDGVVDGTVLIPVDGRRFIPELQVNAAADFGRRFIPELQMNAAADFMVGIEPAKTDRDAKIRLFAKSGGSYELADLEGEWRIAGYAEVVSGAHGAEKITGRVELDDQGGLVEAGNIGFGGQGEILIPGIYDFAIDANGLFHTPLGGDFLMQLAAGKTLAIGRAVGWEDNGRNKHQIYVFVKTAAGAVDSDMAGDWFIKRFSDQSVENDPGVMSGSIGIGIDEAGASITGGHLEVGYSAEWTVAGGTVETDDQGGVSFDDITYHDSEIVTTAQVHLEATGGVFAGHATDSDFRIALIVGVPEPDTVLLGLVSLAVLFALRRRSFPSFTVPRI